MRSRIFPGQDCCRPFPLKMNRKLSQSIMVWFLPLIIIGGLFWPLLGYLVFFMMLFFLILSYFKARFWCANLCPRGSFLDSVLSKISMKRKTPALFLNSKFRWAVFVIFISIFIFQFIIVEKNIYAMGFVFVRICLITTLIAIIVGIPARERTWCVICPMGTLQSKIGSLKKERK